MSKRALPTQTWQELRVIREGRVFADFAGQSRRHESRLPLRPGERTPRTERHRHQNLAVALNVPVSVLEKYRRIEVA